MLSKHFALLLWGFALTLAMGVQAKPRGQDPLRELVIPAEVREYVVQFEREFANVEDVTNLEREDLERFDGKQQFPKECDTFVHEYTALVGAYYERTLAAVDVAGEEDPVLVDLGEEIGELMESDHYKEANRAKDICIIVKPELFADLFESSLATSSDED